MLEIIFLLHLRKAIFLSELQQCPCGIWGFQQEPLFLFSWKNVTEIRFIESGIRKKHKGQEERRFLNHSFLIIVYKFIKILAMPGLSLHPPFSWNYGKLFEKQNFVKIYPSASGSRMTASSVSTSPAR